MGEGDYVKRRRRRRRRSNSMVNQPEAQRSIHKNELNVS